MTDPTAATYQNATLLKFARAALTHSVSGTDVPWEEFDLSDPEQRRFGDYELRELLGRGGMGVVYRAWQEELSRDVAIKFIAMDFADDARIVGRFLDEARAAARLHHRHIVPVFEVGSADCLHYFTMPLMRGQTLADLAKRGTLSTTDKVVLLRKVCSAVSYAHSLGMLHLDLKPENIMLDQHEQPLIGDFGLARQMNEAGEVTAQEVSGTPAFMAPEQVQIKQFRLTERTDVYALGAILYRLLTGESPHGRGGAQELMQNAASGRVRPVRSLSPQVDEDLAAICEHCLELQPQDRYATAAEVEEDLRRYLDGNAVSVRRAGIIERTRRAVARNPGVALASATAVLAMLIGLLATTWQWQVAEDARALAEDRASTMSQLARMIAVVHPESRWDQIEDPVAAMLEWLRTHGGSPEQQRDLLVAFIDALKEAGKVDAVADLLWAIPDELGREYRSSLATELATSDEGDDLLAAALLMNAEDPKMNATLEKINVIFGNEPTALLVLAQQCDTGEQRSSCAHFGLRERLRALVPEQIIAWTYGFEGALDAEAIQGMAAQPTLKDGLEATAAIILDRVGSRPAPRALAALAEAILPGDEAARFVAMDTSFLPIPGMSPIVWACHPGRPEFLAGLRKECLQIARKLFNQQPSSVITTHIGGVMLRRLAEGTTEAERAYEFRRRFVWINEQLPKNHVFAGPVLRFYEVAKTDGEWAFYRELAETHSIPLDPPAEWVPKDPEMLMLPEDRPSRQEDK